MSTQGFAWVAGLLLLASVGLTTAGEHGMAAVAFTYALTVATIALACWAAFAERASKF